MDFCNIWITGVRFQSIRVSSEWRPCLFVEERPIVYLVLVQVSNQLGSPASGDFSNALVAGIGVVFPIN